MGRTTKWVVKLNAAVVGKVDSGGQVGPTTITEISTSKEFL